MQTCINENDKINVCARGPVTRGITKEMNEVKQKQARQPTRKRTSAAQVPSGKKKKAGLRLLTATEKKLVGGRLDKVELLAFVTDSVTNGLVTDLFPERMELWKHLQNSKADELEYIILTASEKYVEFYNKHGKGQEKYANLYLTWLNYISSLTCRSQQSLSSLCLLVILLGDYTNMLIQLKTQRTVIACILHSVQDGVQSQMAAEIEVISEGVNSKFIEEPGDDTALYRISGSALKSVINTVYTTIAEQTPDASASFHSEKKKELVLLEAIKRPNTEKIRYRWELNIWIVVG